MAEIKLTNATVKPVVIKPAPGTFFRYPDSTEVHVQLAPGKQTEPLGENQFHAGSLLTGEVNVHDALATRVLMDGIELFAREYLFESNDGKSAVAFIK